MPVVESTAVTKAYSKAHGFGGYPYPCKSPPVNSTYFPTVNSEDCVPVSNLIDVEPAGTVAISALVVLF